MNVWKTVLFIFGVLTGLALISVVQPAGGIRLGNISLEWPTLHEVLTPIATDDNTSDADQAIQTQIAALRNAKRKEFDDFYTNNPARIYLPNNDTTYLD